MFRSESNTVPRKPYLLVCPRCSFMVSIPLSTFSYFLTKSNSLTGAYLHYLNRRQAAKRVRMVKVGNVIDTSILNIKDAAKARVETNLKEGVKNDQAFLDLTDFQNEDFVYVL